MCASGSLASSVGAGGSGAAEVRAGGGAAAVEVGVGVDVVGALLDEMAVVLDGGCCHGRHGTPITPSSSSTATETTISHRVTELAESPWAVEPSVLDGDGAASGLRAAGAGLVGAPAACKVCGAAVSVMARAKSVQHANRSSGFLANAAARTGSSEAISGCTSASAGLVRRGDG